MKLFKTNGINTVKTLSTWI